jgi:hypothetical protein
MLKHNSNQPGKVLEQIGKPVVLVNRVACTVPSNCTVVSTVLKHLFSSRPINSYCVRSGSMKLWRQSPIDVIVKYTSSSCRDGWTSVWQTVK